MEFRNHQARILHTFTALRANPLGLVLVLLLLPVFLGLILLFAVLALAGMLLTLFVNTIISLFSGGARRPRGFPAPSGAAPPQSPRPDPPPGAGPTIDVEVVRRE